jgi:hypothetical protein
VLQNTKTNSKLSELKITDLRTAVVTGEPFTVPLLRIDTNQGISGSGEVRDGTCKIYALARKIRILGENPCDIDRIFPKIKQFGFHARQGGGCSAMVSADEIDNGDDDADGNDRPLKCGWIDAAGQTASQNSAEQRSESHDNGHGPENMPGKHE